MKNTLLLLLLLFCCRVQVKSQPAPSGETQIVNEVITKFFDGIKDLDLEKMKLHVTSDFLLLEDGAIWNIDSLGNALLKYKKMNYKRTNKFVFLNTKLMGGMAWVAYRNTAEMMINDKPRIIKWIESAVLVKINNAWKIQLLHSTKLE